MVLYYAMGGGLGHLTRAVAFLNTLSIGDDAAIITSSSWAEDPRVINGLEAIRPPATVEDDRDGFGHWIRDTITKRRPQKFVVDSFPAGILGELTGLTPEGRYELWHLSRLLKWGSYERRIGDAGVPAYDVVWETEALHPDHGATLRSAAKEVRYLELTDPDPSTGVPEIEGAHWLVVHSGPREEVEELLRYAIDMRRREHTEISIVLVSPVRPSVTAPGVSMIDVYPAWPLFAAADRIISAAGYNIMRQASPFRGKHRFVPFPRALDDQYTRASRARQSAADR